MFWGNKAVLGLFVFSAALVGVATYLSETGFQITEVIFAYMFGICFWVTLLIPAESQRRTNYEIVLVLTACMFLGSICGLCIRGGSISSLYFALLSLFHMSEFMIPVLFSGAQPLFDLFLLNHGKEYAFAFTVSAIEYTVSPFRLPDPVRIIGAIVALIGLLLRASALLTAGQNFTHAIATRKTTRHTLVTTGPYHYMRHPGYSGWFLWVIGSQLLLGNMVSLVGFSVVTYIFFKSRIGYEEDLLIRFFGVEYKQYMLETRFSGVPFI